MSDVTCKAVHTYMDLVESRGVAPARLAAQIGYPLDFLRDKNNRIPWSVFVEVGKQSRALCNLTDRDLEEFGRGVFKSGPLRLVMSLARVLGDPARFYTWMQRGNKMLFANMQSTVVATNPQQLSIHIKLREQDEQSYEYLLISKGAIASMPTLLGYPEANVMLHTRGSEAIFDVTMKPKRRSFVRSALQAVSGRYETAEELLATNEALTRRLEELSAANEQIREQAHLLDQQAARLELAHDISRVIHGTYDLQGTLDTIVATLHAHTSATAVRLEVMMDVAGAPTSARASAGAADGTAFTLVLPIAVRGNDVGMLRLSAVSVEAEKALAASLEYVLPVLAMALDNAHAYGELSHYQKGLERLVEERTAELRTARDDLAATVEQLQDAQSTRERIFANISHEIRTPLSVILLAVSDVETRVALDERSRANLGSVVESTRRLLRLVDELLLLAAGQETALRVSPVPSDLGALLGAIAVTWRSAAEAARLTLTYRGPERAAAMIDPIAIERVVSNLLSNAVKYTPSGGRVDLELRLDGAAITIAVRDTGIGIDDDLRERLFGRFERGSGVGARTGSGIGLSLVKELVEAHGGTVAVERGRGGGTEFTVTLPFVESARPAQDDHGLALRPGDFGLSAPPVSTGQIFTPVGRSTATILVAEDDPQLAARIAGLLAEDHTVIVALDGLAALELAQKHRPHLLVTDVEMPGMDGIELTRRFRESTGEQLAPVLILSALADLGDRVGGLEAGATDYIVKPFDPRELRARVRAQLGMRDIAVRLHRAEQLSALGTLSSGLAHELRNPANAIVNAVGPLKRLLPPELSDPESPVGQLVDVLASCAEQVAFLSRQLLSFRRGGDLELREVPLGDVVQRAITLAGPALREVSIRERITVVGSVRCAPPLLVQVLTNLFENAAHAAGAGGWVEIAGTQDNGKVTVEIADSGPGVPLELRDRIFEPFFTTKPPGHGTGLGLPLARDIMHRHGGVLEVREREHRSVFVLELPAVPPR
jgi:signal transduction histidine kinase